MTTKMRRCFKSNENRPNYAKRAKDFGIEYISIRKIQKHFKEDWEKQIESSELRFNWEHITKYLIRRDVLEMSHLQFMDFINELISEGLPIKERRWLRSKYSSTSYPICGRIRRHIKTLEIISKCKLRKVYH